MSDSSANKRIAKNTVLLYLRSLLMLAIGIYTSRIVLEALGIENFGIYGVVGSFVGMFTLINGILSAGTSRFITFELGKNNIDAVNKVFNAAFIMHCIAAVILLVILETVGLWFLNNKLNIPEGREIAANWVFQLSILSCCLGIIQVPYGATIIAHERFDLYAYVGIAEAVFKCLVPFVLIRFKVGDVLIIFALLLTVWSVGLQIFYQIYCIKHFPETRLRFVKELSVYKSMMGYSLWDFLGQICVTLNIQGLPVLINMFFGVTLNAAQNIATQVQDKVQGFIGNFTTSVNPQIVKSYAVGDFHRFFQLIFESGKYAYYLFLFIALPLFLECDYVLSIWLVKVPEHASVFLRGLLLICLLRTPANPIIRAVHATGRIKFMNLTGGLQAVILLLPGTYICYKIGLPYWSYLVVYAITQFNGTVLEIMSLRREIEFSVWDYVKDVYGRIILVTVLSAIIPTLCVMLLPPGIFRFLITGSLCVIFSGISIIYVGLSKAMRKRLYGFIRHKICVLLHK